MSTNHPDNNSPTKLRCGDCGEPAKTYYDKEMFAVDGEGFVTDCGTGGCGFSVGKTREDSRRKFQAKHGARIHD